MDSSEIKNKDSLKAWLETQSQEVAVAIAHRAAMRAAPEFWMLSAPTTPHREQNATELARGLLLSGLLVNRRSDLLIDAAKRAHNWQLSLANRLPNLMQKACLSSSAYSLSSSYISHHTEDSAHATWCASEPASTAISVGASLDLLAEKNIFGLGDSFSEVRRDGAEANNGSDLFSLSLWSTDQKGAD